MFTLATSVILGSELVEIIGIILSILEAIIVILTLVSYFVPPESDFGKKLSRILVGLYKTKTFVDNVNQNLNKDKKEEDNNDDHTISK